MSVAEACRRVNPFPVIGLLLAGGVLDLESVGATFQSGRSQSVEKYAFRFLGTGFCVGKARDVRRYVTLFPSTRG
jgi:hypothetical protein